MYAVARYNTAPDMVHFACKHGIKQNPLYMQCDKCGNIFCEIRGEIAAGLRPRPGEVYSQIPPEDIAEGWRLLNETKNFSKTQKPKSQPVNFGKFFGKIKSLLREYL